MARRIALVTLGLITALLTLAVVPLGLSLTANERASFRFGVESSARQLSAQAEEYLADRDSAAVMDRALAKRPSAETAGSSCVHPDRRSRRQPRASLASSPARPRWSARSARARRAPCSPRTATGCSPPCRWAMTAASPASRCSRAARTR